MAGTDKPQQQLQGQQQQPEQQQQPQQPGPRPPSNLAQDQRQQSGAVGPYRGGGSVMSRSRIGSSPLSLLGRLMGDMDRLFEDFALGRGISSPLAALTGIEPGIAQGPWMPQVDIFERGGNLVVHADLPGLKQADVNVNVDDGILTISGERTHERTQETGGIYRRERSFGSFQRSVALPEGVNPESIQASFDNGVLEVSMPIPKEEPTKGRSIPIRSGSETPGVRH